MVKGVKIFRTFFKDFTDNYILIGGAACDEHMTDAGLSFRATKDLDIILTVEALNSDFVEKFWEFIKEGNYKTKQKSEGERYKKAFLKKTEFKGIKFKNVGQLINDKSIKIIRTAWESSLKYQIPDEKLPDVEIVVRELKEILEEHIG